MFRVLLALLVLLPGFCQAADTIVPNQRFRVPFAVDGKPLKLGAKAEVTVDPLGKLTLELLYAKDGDGEKQLYWLTPKGGPSPDPNPNPTPDPLPNPNKAAYLYLIHESKDSSPAQNVVRMDTAWKVRAEALKIRWTVVDKDRSVDALPVATAKAIKAGLPAVVWLDSAGLAKAEKCPDTPAAMLALVERIGGGK